MKIPATVKLNFWPSKDEINDSKSTNAYLGGLEEFIDSVNSLKNNINTTGFSQKETIVPEKGFNVIPETILSVIISLGTAGSAVGLYNLYSAP